MTCAPSQWVLHSKLAAETWSAHVADRIVSGPNPGDSWCICMWATASLIEKVGCKNVHLRCDATDVDYVLSSYHDGGQSLHAAHECLKEKCGEKVFSSRRLRRASMTDL